MPVKLITPLSVVLSCWLLLLVIQNYVTIYFEFLAINAGFDFELINVILYTC